MSTQEPQGKAAILIVEDNATMVQMISKLLERETILLSSPRTEETLRMLRLGEPTAPAPSISPNLNLLDILLPGTGGFEVLDELRAARSRLACR